MFFRQVDFRKIIGSDDARENREKHDGSDLVGTSGFEHFDAGDWNIIVSLSNKFFGMYKKGKDEQVA